MNKKIGPFVFVGVLVAILVFIIGVQYGQKIEKTNKAINYVLSITPNPTNLPIPTTTVEYKTYKNTSCGFQFLYPANLSEVVESTDSGRLDNQKQTLFAFSCKKADEGKMIEELKSATDTVKLKNTQVKVAYLSSNELKFVLNSPKNTKTKFVINRQFFPLFEKTFEFLTQY